MPEAASNREQAVTLGDLENLTTWYGTKPVSLYTWEIKF